MKTFKEFMAEQNDNAYGWLNPKGSFIRNRKGNIHGDTYSKFSGHGKVDHDDGPGYYDKIDHALSKGWQRLDVYSDKRNKTVDGLLQGRKDKWTPRHTKAMRLIKKALGVKKGYKNEIEKVRT